MKECKALDILETSPLLFSPKVVDTNTKSFRLEIDKDVFVGYPIHIREEDKETVFKSKKRKNKKKMTDAIPVLHAAYSSSTSSLDKKNVANVSLFNVVFALRYANDSDKKNNNTYTILDMSKCAEYVSKTLLYEEKRCGWISNSVTSLSYHRERYDEENKKGGKQSWRSRALELSSLARELKDLYDQLNRKDESHALDLKWHRWLKLSFVLSNPSRKQQQEDSTFRPYVTLTLIAKK